MSETERYRECIRALEKCTGSTVCRFEFELRHNGSASIIVTADSREHEDQMAKLAITILGKMYNNPEPTGDLRRVEEEL